MCRRFVQACTAVGGAACTKGAAVLLKAVQKSLVAFVRYFLVVVFVASSLALTSRAVWAVLCFSSLVGSSAGISSTRVGVGDGLKGCYVWTLHRSCSKSRQGLYGKANSNWS